MTQRYTREDHLEWLDSARKNKFSVWIERNPNADPDDFHHELLRSRLGGLNYAWTKEDVQHAIDAFGLDFVRIYWIKILVKFLNRDMEPFLKRFPHIETGIDRNGLITITHDDDRALFHLSTAGAGR